MRRGFTIALLVLGVLAVIYGWTRAVRPSAPPKALSPPESPAPSGPLAELRWVLRGSRVLVDQRWLWDPDGGTFTALPYSTIRPVEGGGEEWLGIALSRDGTRIAVWDEREFHVGPVDAALAGPFALPFALEPDEADAMRARLLFWNGRDELLFCEQRLDTDARSTCARFEPSTRTWRRGGTCPEGLFFRLTQVDPGPGDWVAVFSEAEGTQGFQLTRFSDGKPPPDGFTPLGFELYPAGDVRAQFSQDGTRLALTTPCELERPERPCLDVNDSTPWRLYTWRLAERRWARERDGLPARVVASPEGGQLAWPEPGRVCMSDSPEVKRCQALPPVPRRAE